MAHPKRNNALLRSSRLFCVTTVSIVCTIKAPVPVRAEDGLDRPLSLTVLTMLTVLWDGFSPMAVILIVRVPKRPSRPKTISIPSVRGKVCTRRSRPASARGVFGQPDRSAIMGLPATWVPASKRSDALPVHRARSAMISRTRAATGSASTMLSIASRACICGGFNLPAGRNAPRAKPASGRSPSHWSALQRALPG